MSRRYNYTLHEKYSDQASKKWIETGHTYLAELKILRSVLQLT